MDSSKGRGNGVLAARIKSVLLPMAVGGTAVIKCEPSEARRVINNATVTPRMWKPLKACKFAFADMSDTDAKGVRVWREV